ncbi:hypothetical protein THF5H11_11200 [Vibrio jasicida]|uniref:Uncharacterized protein n=1 Tax=Vibrio jasicida TaxID=766224 RepID=A0AAU9QMP2_9VIBR|nr:hypothetical protein THF5H11_11200 [Vibrio jasicida]CAH1591526.1 hypothetical protein THF1C08_300047 [Vibrio jasicida]CAH1594691.1 hypothetical protein THF1A12_290048 [Vibrio jasicida]CAH1604746.1 hypothetical protein THF5G08_10635 [Vibrio jasicida]
MRVIYALSNQLIKKDFSFVVNVAYWNCPIDARASYNGYYLSLPS